ncbi:MAG: LacI family DNA-binding transcriptional regulator [Oscillospiraceae bacterium]|nr:LacI family DNA-binding transcriptional regulator [Oscillospiraceae bacterium]
MKRVTIQDIADELGISRNTVSKAINNADGLADATREKILEKAIEMGYKQFSYIKAHSGLYPRPEALCRGEIALLYGGIISPAHFATLMLDKLKRDLPRWGYDLNAYRVERENLLCRTLPPTFDPGQVSAIICVEMFDRAYDEMICSLGLPVLFVDGPNKRDGIGLPADQLYMDNTTAITRFVNDMLLRGRRRIGFIGDFEHCQSFFERYTAFRYAMLMANAPVEERFCIKSIERERLEEALESLEDLPDVFICANDFVAEDAIYALRKLGKSVPEDVLFCGFDDSPNSRIMTPTLTTVHIHTQVMAVVAMHLLLSRIEEPGLDFRITHTETELIYRDSTRV